jgi:hypothetical protein
MSRMRGELHRYEEGVQGVPTVCHGVGAQLPDRLLRQETAVRNRPGSEHDRESQEEHSSNHHDLGLHDVSPWKLHGEETVGRATAPGGLAL